MNNGWVYQDKIGKSAIAETVLEYYAQRYQHSTIAQWQERIESSQILLNQKPTTISTRLTIGDHLSYHRPPWQEPSVPLDFQILHQDQDLLVINKPSGLPVLAGGGFLEHTLWFQLQKLFPQQTPIPIHRLGRGTSGLMILARSSVAKSKLSQQMRSHQITKVYLAIAQGIITQDQFTIEQPIGKLPHPVLGYIYGSSSPFTWRSSVSIGWHSSRHSKLSKSFSHQFPELKQTSNYTWRLWLLFTCLSIKISTSN